MDIFIRYREHRRRKETKLRTRVVLYRCGRPGVSLWAWCEAFPPVPVRVVLFASVSFFSYWFLFLSIYTHHDHCTKMVTFTGCFCCVKIRAFFASFVHHCNYFKIISFIPNYACLARVCIHQAFYAVRVKPRTNHTVNSAIPNLTADHPRFFHLTGDQAGSGKSMAGGWKRRPFGSGLFFLVSRNGGFNGNSIFFKTQIRGHPFSRLCSGEVGAQQLVDPSNRNSLVDTTAVPVYIYYVNLDVPH